MMCEYIALLRGINVGKAKRVAMADLRDLVAGLGYKRVRTLLNSGNVIFSGPSEEPKEVASRIERALENEVGFSSWTTVLTAEELDRIVSENPLLGIMTNPSRLLVTVLREPTDRGLLEPLLKQEWDPEALALGGRVAYLWCPKGLLESRLPEAMGALLGEAATTRNWATMTKLKALLDGPD